MQRLEEEHSLRAATKKASDNKEDTEKGEADKEVIQENNCITKEKADKKATEEAKKARAGNKANTRSSKESKEKDIYAKGFSGCNY